MHCGGIYFMFTAVILGAPVAALAQEGPQVGMSIVPFNPLNPVTGTKEDVTEPFGRNPVVMVCAKQADANFAKLVKELDSRVAKENKAGKLRLSAMAILCNDEDDAQAKLLTVRVKHKIANVVLAIYQPQGPPKLHLSREAQVTVILYQDYKVRVVHAFKKGELDEKAISKILNDIPCITERQKKP